MRFCYSHILDGRIIRHYPMIGRKPSMGTTPCWSLAALLNFLPRVIDFGAHDTFLLIYPTQNLGWVVEYSNHDIVDFSFDNKNLIDACYKMILKLHELKLL